MKGYRYKKSYKTKRKISVFRILKLILGNKFFWLGTLILSVLGGLTYLFFFSAVFQIKKVEVLGAGKTPQAEINRIVSEKTRNIFLADLSGISQSLKKSYPQIDQIKIKREFPDKITVNIEERNPAAVFCQPSLSSGFKIFGQKEEKICYYIDKSGMAFEKISENLSEKNSPVIQVKNTLYIELGQKVIAEDYLSSILDIKSKLKIAVSEIYPISPLRINIKTIDGWYIYFNPREDIQWQIEEADIVLKEKIPPEERKNLEYIDLRFEKVYIYPEIRISN